ACTSSLAVACFVKAFGMVFLARPRSEYIGVIHEANFLSRAGMGILTTFIIILGFFAGVISRFLLKISNSLINLKNIESSALMNFNFIKMHNEFASISTPIILIAIVLLLFIVIFFVYTLSRKQKVVTNITWDCGCSLEPGMEITATGFSRSIVSVFKNIL
ncbi:MAG: hypothetical protein NT091_03785, partial [Candidatus Falkowbacteria bacterium]|nr:hypothetical protein [Candidatus Falkowbacteria bacterium]